jgi:hypothetical protein
VCFVDFIGASGAPHLADGLPDINRTGVELMFWKKKPGQSGALQKPEQVTSDPQAAEILSVWLCSDANNVVVLKPDTWPDPLAWGLLLADISRHLANALAESTHADPAQTIARIRAGFNVEMDTPTDTPTGKWQ